MCTRRRSRTFLPALALIIFGLPLFGQTTGRISGFVKDPAGAAIPSVNVTARMTEQQSTSKAVTNSEGFYDFVALPPGDYEFVFEAAGFRRQVRSGVELTINQNLRVDAALEVGSLETQVTVNGTAPLVDTVSPMLSGLIDDRRVVDLPLNGRNIMSLAAVLPGVLGVSVPQQMDNARSGPIMDVNGGRSNMNLFTFNGGYFNNPSRNTGIDYPPPDAVEEIRILTHDFSAEYGHNPGSQVMVVSKSGTNQFHGAAWEFLRNNAFNARNFFAPTVPGGAPGSVRRRCRRSHPQGFAVHLRRLSGAASTISRRNRCSPSCPPRRSAPAISPRCKTTLTNPNNPLTGKPLMDPVTGLPCVAGNKIATGCINSGVRQAALLRAPNRQRHAGDASRQSDPRRYGNGAASTGTRARSIASSAPTFSTATVIPVPLAGSSTLANYMSESFNESTDVVVVNDVYTFTPRLLNQATFSWNRTNSSQVEDKTVKPTTLGINLPQYPTSGAITAVVSGNFTLGSGTPTFFWSQNCSGQG